MIRDWYLGYLMWRLTRVERKLKWLTICRDSTEFKEWTEGYLGWLERRVDELTAARDRLKGAFYRWV